MSLIGLSVTTVVGCYVASISEIQKCEGCTGRPDCECIDLYEQGCVKRTDDNMLEFSDSSLRTSNVEKVPAQYGSGCSAWDVTDGMHYFQECLEDDPPSWCKDQ